jgi:hypothetical protein
MKMQITATTDRQWLGHTFDSTDNPIVLGDMEVAVERTLPLSDGIRFISSNYIIDAKEV